MPKVLLDKNQINKLIVVTVEILNFIKSKKKEIDDNKISESLKNIQVPVRLSESIALNLILDNVIPELKDYTFLFGKKRGDYDIVGNSNKKYINHMVGEMKPKFLFCNILILTLVAFFMYGVLSVSIS